MALSQCAAFLVLVVFLTAFSYAQEVEEANKKVDKKKEHAQLLIGVLGYTEARVKKLEADNEKKRVTFSNLLLSQKNIFSQHKASAQAFISRGDFVKAYYHCLEAKRIYEYDPEIQSYIGVVLLDMRLFAEAEETYRYCLVVDPANVIHRYNLGESLYVQKKYEQSLAEFDIAEKLCEKTEKKDLISVVRIKQLLCYLGLSKKFAESDKNKSEKYLKKYKEQMATCLEAKYSMGHYYAMVIEYLRVEKTEEATTWRGYAQKIWPSKLRHRPYVDAMIEFGLVASYYGEIAEKNLDSTLGEGK